MSPTYCCKNPTDHVLLGRKEPPITPCQPSSLSIPSPPAPSSPMRKDRYSIIEIHMYHPKKTDSSSDGTGSPSSGYKCKITSHDNINIETLTTSTAARSPVPQVSSLTSSSGSSELNGSPTSFSSTSTSTPTLSPQLKQKHSSSSSSLSPFKSLPSIPLLQSLSASKPSPFPSQSASYYFLSSSRPKSQQQTPHQNKNKQNDHRNQHNTNNQSDTNVDNYDNIDTFIPQQSKTILKSNKINLKNKITKHKGGGDGDIWIERRCVNKKTGVKKMLFVSVKTGDIAREPPSGASRVVYADDLVLRCMGAQQGGYGGHDNVCEDDERCETLDEKDLGIGTTDDLDNNGEATVPRAGGSDIETIYIIQ